MRTEDVSPRFAELDLWPAGDVVAAVLDGQLAAAAMARAAAPAIAPAVDAAAAALERGDGRLVYLGAGTSGRLAVQDAVELPPTFGWPEERLLPLIAGGPEALTRSVEAAEDDAANVRGLIATYGVGAGDVVIAVAASGTTPFAVAGLRVAGEQGAVTIGIANNAPSPLLDAAAFPVALPTGAEVVAGSTRLAAGTAQKAALNALSTAIMVRLGRTYDNLMVDVAARNIKLEGRRIAMLRRIVDVDEATAVRALDRAGGHVKAAVLVALGDDATTAAARLARHGGRLRAARAELG